MKDVPAATQLHQRNGVYYFRARISSDIIKLLTKHPAEVQQLLRRRIGRPVWVGLLLQRNRHPKKEILISLKTKSYKEARARQVEEQTKLHGLYRDVKLHFEPQNAPSLRKATVPEIEALALRRFVALEHPPLGARKTNAEWPDMRTNEQREEDLISDIVGARQDHPLAMSSFLRMAADMLLKNDISFDEGDAAHERLAKLLQRAEIEHGLRSLDRFHGKFATQHDNFFPASTKSEDEEIAARKTVTLRKLISDFEKNKLGHLKAKSLAKYQFLFRILFEVLGDTTDVRAISRQDCRKVSDLLKRLPPNYSKMEELKALGVEKAAALAEAKGMTPLSRKSLEDYHSKFSKLFQWAESEDMVIRSNANDLLGAMPAQAEEDKKSAFDSDRLSQMFGEASPQNIILGEAGSKFWAPLIALYTGLRLNEILQMYVTDLKMDGDVAYFDISLRNQKGEKAPDKSLKRETTRRKVPIHRDLVSLGFLNYVDELERRHEDRIFPDAKISKDGMYSTDFSKWFSRRMESLGLKVDSKHSFHSFRHTFTDAMRRARLSADIVEALGGWAPNRTSSRYGSGFTPSELKSEIDKLCFPGLDLTYLKRSRRFPN